MNEKGTCEKHGEFILAEGCPGCLAERREAGITPAQDELEDGLNQEGMTLAGAEELDRMVNLCDTCTLRMEYPVCSPRDVVFGDGHGHDNIIKCPNYDGELKSPAPETGLFAKALQKGQIESGPFAKSLSPQETEPKPEISTVEPAPTAIVKIAPDKDPGYIKLLAETTKLLEYSTKLVIKGMDDKKAATNDLIIMGDLSKQIETTKKEWLGPIDEHRKTVFDMFRQLTEPLAQAVRQTKAAMLSFDQEQERIRREQEAINREKQALAEREAAVSGQPVEPVELVEVAPEVSTTVRTDLGSVSQRENWKYQVEDFAALPDEFKVADTTMLNTIAKKYHDKKQIPGVRFYNEPTITRRAS